MDTVTVYPGYRIPEGWTGKDVLDLAEELLRSEHNDPTCPPLEQPAHATG